MTFRAGLKQILLTGLFCSGWGAAPAQQQSPTPYSRGRIPELASFEQLTAHEKRLDSLTDQHNKEKLQRMEDGSAFVAGVSEKEQKEAIAYEKIRAQSYRDNRSRYALEQTVNGKPNPDFRAGAEGPITSGCDCFLSGDTIHIKMGLWVFGGFSFQLLLEKNGFQSGYWEDTHKQFIYKNALTDTVLVDNVYVENTGQALVLNNPPRFAVGERLLGFFTFKTADYYKTHGFDAGIPPDAADHSGMDRLQLKGAVHFKCQVRQKTFMEE